MSAAGGLSRLPPRTLTTLLSVLAEADQLEMGSPSSSIPKGEVDSASPLPEDPADIRSSKHLFIHEAARHISQARLSDYSWQDLSNALQALSMQTQGPADADARGLDALSTPTKETRAACRLAACAVIGEEALRRASAIITADPSLGGDADHARGMARDLASFAWAAAVGGFQGRGELVGGSLLDAFESLVCGLKPGSGELELMRGDIRKFQQALLLSGQGGSHALQTLITGERERQASMESAVAGSSGDEDWDFGWGGGGGESHGGGVIVSSPFHKEVSREMRRLGINHENEVGCDDEDLYVFVYPNPSKRPKHTD